MGRAHEKWHICKCLIFHAKNLLKVYTQKNSGYTKSRRKIRQQKIPKIDSKFLHIELLSREAWASKDTRFLTLSPETILRMKKIPAGRNAEIMAFADRDSAVTFRLCCRSAAGAGIFPGWPVRRGCAALIYSHPALPGPGRLGKG